jgi:hypothetical protein
MGKGKIIAIDSILPSLRAPDLDMSNVSEPAAGRSNIMALKKRKAGGSMDHFVDHPLSEQEQADENTLLFRCAVRAHM